jgi:hypothetical protein
MKIFISVLVLTIAMNIFAQDSYEGTPNEDDTEYDLYSQNHEDVSYVETSENPEDYVPQDTNENNDYQYDDSI